MLVLVSVLMLPFGSIPGTVSVGTVDNTLDPLTLKDLEAFPSNESLLGRLAGDLPTISTRRGSPPSEISSSIGDACGIILDLRRVLSLRIGPTFDRLRVPLVEDAARRGVDVGRRREGLSLCSPLLGMCKVGLGTSSLAGWFILLSESGGTRLTGEPFSSASCRHPSDVAPFVLRNPGSRRLGLGRLQELGRRLEEDREDGPALGTVTKLRLRLSSVRSSSHSLSEPATE